jgi:predicted HAD superfamily hydrolase
VFIMDAQLQQQLHGAAMVSFDVFDTAILRPLTQPTDLFRLLQPGMQQLHGTVHLDFHRVRMRAERQAREHAWEIHRATEVTLANIYAVIQEMTGLPADVVERMQKLEIEAEQVICRPNPVIREVYQWCLAHQKHVLFISDTYLPETVIAGILNACGYRQRDGLLVSSTLGKTKATGELFAEALSCFPHPPARWLHLGDNLESDVVRARDHQLTTWHCPRQATSLTKDINPGELVARGLMASRPPVHSDTTFWQNFGYTTAGPLFVGFTEWLIAQASQRHLQRLYFLSRDGLIMKRVYETLTAQNPNAAEARYLYASRRASNVAAIEEIDDRTLNFLMSGTSVLQAAQFVQRLGVDWREHAATFRVCGFRSPQQLVVTAADRACLRKLLLALAEPIRARARRERPVLMDYLAAAGLRAEVPVGMVDIGWHGSMQRAITDLLRSDGAKPGIVGLYLGTYQHAVLAPELEYPHEAYLFTLGQPPAMVALIQTCVEIVELLFSATEGSVTCIERKPNGEFTPVMDDSDLEPHRVDIIRHLQAGAMEFAEEYARLKAHFSNLGLVQATAVAQLQRVLLHPTRREAECLGNISHGEGFGDVYTKRLIARPPSSRLMLTSPRQYRKQFCQAFWEIGCLARLSPWERRLGRLLGAIPW